MPTTAPSARSGEPLAASSRKLGGQLAHVRVLQPLAQLVKSGDPARGVDVGGQAAQ